jgi:hypothetical protein
MPKVCALPSQGSTLEAFKSYSEGGFSLGVGRADGRRHNPLRKGRTRRILRPADLHRLLQGFVLPSRGDIRGQVHTERSRLHHGTVAEDDVRSIGEGRGPEGGHRPLPLAVFQMSKVRVSLTHHTN